MLVTRHMTIANIRAKTHCMANKSRHCGQMMENEHEKKTKCESQARIESETRTREDKWM